MWYIFLGIIFSRIGEKVSSKERIRMERFVLESRFFRRNGKKYNSVGNLFGTLATTVNRVFLQYPERSFYGRYYANCYPSDPFKLFVLSSFHPWKNVNNGATFFSEQSFVRFLSRHIKLSYCYIYIYDFTDRGEFSNSRLYGEILEPLVIESGNEKPVALDVSIYFLFQISS